MQDLIEQEKNCTGHIDSKSPWRYSATNNTAWAGRGTHLILRGTSFGLSSSWVPCSLLTCWEMLTHCLPAHQGWVSSGSQHSPLCVQSGRGELKDSFPGVSSPAGLSLTPMWKLPPVASNPVFPAWWGGRRGFRRGWPLKVEWAFVCDSSDGEGKREEGHLGNFRQLNRDGGSMGPKARGEAGGIIRSQSMQGLTSTIEFEPCFVSNGTFWAPLERPCIIVLIQLLSIFYIPRAALTTCYLFPTTANSMGSIIYPILQMRKLRNSEIKKLAQGYSSIKWGSWVWNSNSSLNVYPICHAPEWMGWSDPGCWQRKPPSRVDFCMFA